MHDGSTRLTQVRALARDVAPHGVGRRAADTLADAGADIETCMAAVLADPQLSERISLDRIAADHGAAVANLVKHVRWWDSIADGAATGERQAESMRRMVLAMVDDVRAVLVKLAYRLERLRGLARESYETRRQIARETLDIYSPLANRLGLGRFRWELEDLAFRYLEPQAYKSLARALEEKRTQREHYIAQFIQAIDAALRADGLAEFEAYGRAKHIYSIWRKMQRKQLAFSDLFDIHAVRILVPGVSDCYLALGAVHSRWRPIPGEFDDYIANPKRNRYQSLHTAVAGPQGKAVEVQIRTREMHDFAEFGVAAHWRYKEGGDHDEYLERTVRELRGLLDGDDQHDALETFRHEAFSDRVFVFTPRGEVVDLPRGATPLDFAYSVHTLVGHRCRGAKVNGRIVNLRTLLHNGDHVEILTTSQPAPSRDWLNRDLGYMVSSRARAKVRHWFNQQGLQQQIEQGRQIIEKAMRRHLGRKLPLDTLLSELQRDSVQDLCASVGKNEISTAQLDNAITALRDPQPASEPVLATRAARSPGKAGISISGVGNLLTSLARCCNPVPFDPIKGFITRASGVTVHRADCRNVLRVNEPERVIEVEWSHRDSDQFTAAVKLVAYDRQRLVSDVATAVSAEGVSISSAQVDTDRRRHLANVRLRLEVNDNDQLRRLMDKLAQLNNVISVVRENS